MALHQYFQPSDDLPDPSAPLSVSISAGSVISVSFRKIYKEGQNDTYQKFGGAKELCMAVHPVGGSGGIPPQKNF